MTSTPETPGSPPTIAVLGGGQLGQMLALAAIPLGVGIRSLDPSPDAPAGAVGRLTVGALDDEDALRATARDADVVTYEWEGVPATAARGLERDGWVVHPSIHALATSQDRVEEKTAFTSLGIPVTPFAAVDSAADLVAAVENLGVPAVLKTRRGGYDGKGQHVIRSAGDVDTAWTALAGAGPLVLEHFVPFDREVSIIAVRSVDGDVRTWPLTENVHRDGVLRTSRAPAPGITAALQERADTYAHILLEHFDYVGVLALELFQVGDEFLANEMAPRVHNSGHWTIEGAITSQFENHMRAILGWPLGATDAQGHSVMINCIGVLPDPRTVLGLAGVHLHQYGKSARPGRKVGHLTVTAPDATELAHRLAALTAVLPGDLG